MKPRAGARGKGSEFPIFLLFAVAVDGRRTTPFLADQNASAIEPGESIRNTKKRSSPCFGKEFS
jgi:hypothetical protein